MISDYLCITMKQLLSISALLVLSIQLGLAQCAMCKASVETSLESSNQAAGINTGVLYVLVFVFFALSFFGYLFYKGINSTDLDS